MNIDDGISEVVGSILLVSLVVLAVAIISVGFLSQPPPVQTQELNVIAGNDSTTLYLYHDGGDPMLPGEFKILLDGIDETPEISGAWSIGERINITITQRPERIQIISTRGGQENIIRQISVGQVTGGGVPVTPGPVPTPGPGGGCTQEELDEYAQEYLNETYKQKFSEEMTASAIYITRGNRGGNQASISGWLNLTINSTVVGDSYVIVGPDNNPSRFDLMKGDELSIKFGIQQQQATASIFSLYDMGWTIAGDQTHVYIKRGPNIFPYTQNNNNLHDSWISQYVKNSYASTISITIGGNNAITRLMIPTGTSEPDIVVPGITDSSIIELINIKPADPELFILEYQSGSANPNFRFVGDAEMVERSNVVIYPIP